MACDEKAQEELVALIQHELSADQESAVQKHLESCPACREEYEQYRSVFKTAKRINLVEPTAVFRKNLERRIGEAIEHSKRSAMQKRPGSTAVRLPSVTPGAPAPDAAGPSKRISTPPPAAESVSKRVSARLSTVRREKRRTPWWRYAIAAGVLVLLGLAAVYVVFFLKGKNANDPVKAQRIAAENRWNKRREAPNWDMILAENRVQLPEALAAGDSLYLVPHRIPVFREECVMGYTSADIERFRADAKTDAQKKQLASLVEKATKVSVEAGKLALPPQMVSGYLGGLGNRIWILNLNGRLEFWSASVFERYRGASPLLESNDTPPATPESGLPFE